MARRAKANPTSPIMSRPSRLAKTAAAQNVKEWIGASKAKRASIPEPDALDAAGVVPKAKKAKSHGAFNPATVVTTKVAKQHLPPANMEDSEPESPVKAKKVPMGNKNTTQGNPEKKKHAPAIDIDNEAADISGDEEPEPLSDDDGLGDDNDDDVEDPEDYESELAKWVPKSFQSKSKENLAADFQAWLALEEARRKEIGKGKAAALHKEVINIELSDNEAPVTKTPSAKQRKAMSEMPAWVPQPSQSKVKANPDAQPSPVKSEATPVLASPSITDDKFGLVRDARGKVTKLTDQPVRIQKVVQDALPIIWTKIICYDVFPKALEMLVFIQEGLTEAALNNVYEDFAGSLTSDHNISQDLAPLIKTHLAIMRTRFKTSAALKVGTWFGVGTDTQTTWERVEEMLPLHDYIYPVDGNDRIINNKPYEHPILAYNIYTYDGTIVFPRIPVPALALASAAVYAALAEYSTGSRVNTEFSQATCGDIYKKHALTLDHIHKNTIMPMAGSKLMRKLYDAAMNSGNENTTSTAIPIQFDAMEG
ncbi:hypothetical protein BOTBODRAFT_176431 [Botryobasidium botryosum FD-172 SS1]|uniref:DUF6532 domain-containing protein n=1 Tax=Botryobasidium botryosum (strain FD-172 SS1) TaxID=930990 RepID=A0A067MLN9_BOTB1|nr:hypothetical protein BOTBODRAFT_176431 [Botryobasidium botryosum FD-172 SS1]